MRICVFCGSSAGNNRIYADAARETGRTLARRRIGFVALPGGAGTLEEILEQWNWAQLGIHHKPCGFLNTNGYFDPLRQMIDRMTTEGRQPRRQSWFCVRALWKRPGVQTGPCGGSPAPEVLPDDRNARAGGDALLLGGHQPLARYAHRAVQAGIWGSARRTTGSLRLPSLRNSSQV